MDIINKMMVGALILLVAAFIAPLAQAEGEAVIWNVDVCERTDGLYGEVALKAHCSENTTALINVEVDGIPVCSSFVRVEVEWFKGFPVSPPVRVDFEVSSEVGTHKMEIFMLIEEKILYETYEYTIYEEEVEEEEEEKEDWLQCP